MLHGGAGRRRGRRRRQVRRARRAHHRADGPPRRAPRRGRQPVAPASCEAGYEITVADLEDTERRQGTPVGAGDVVLIRTGWGRLFDEGLRVHRRGDAACPGCPRPGARWLAERAVHAAGADTIAFERLAPRGGHALLPAHRVLLVEHGIYIIEAIDLEELADRRRARVHLRPGAAQHLRRDRLPGAAARGDLGMSGRDPGPAARRVRHGEAVPRRCPTDVVGQRRHADARHPRDRCRRQHPRRPALQPRSWATESGGAPAGHGHRRARPAAGSAGRLRQRRPRALPRLRRHPPALGAAPERQRGPGRPRRAEHAGADGAALVRAVAVGLEVSVRLGMAGYDPETATRSSSSTASTPPRSAAPWARRSPPPCCAARTHAR